MPTCDDPASPGGEAAHAFPTLALRAAAPARAPVAWEDACSDGPTYHSLPSTFPHYMYSDHRCVKYMVEKQRFTQDWQPFSLVIFLVIVEF